MKQNFTRGGVSASGEQTDRTAELGVNGVFQHVNPVACLSAPNRSNLGLKLRLIECPQQPGPTWKSGVGELRG